MVLPPLCLLCTTCCAITAYLVVQGRHKGRAAAVTQKQNFLGLGDHWASWPFFGSLKGGTKVAALCKGGFRAINNELDNVTDICLTIDLWSSRDMRSFVGITGHYTKDYQLQSVMLACQRFRGSHTTERIHEAYERTIATYGLNNLVTVIVTDNAANMIKAFSLPGMKTAAADESDDELDDDDSALTQPDITDELDYLPPDRHSCFAHTLQLVVHDGLKDAGQKKSVIAKASNFVFHVRKSTSATEVLQEYRKLEMANQTRWNSQLKMLRSILQIPSEALDRVNFTGKLSQYELKVISELCEILQPFEEATDQVQGDKVVTSSLVIVCVRGLRDQLHELRQTYNCKLVSSLQASLEKRLQCYELMDCLRIATTLDPRFKLDWCEGEEQDAVKALITQQMPKSLIPEQDCSNTPPAKRSKLMSFMKPRAMASPVKTTSELDDYLREPSLPRKHPICPTGKPISIAFLPWRKWLWSTWPFLPRLHLLSVCSVWQAKCSGRTDAPCLTNASRILCL